MYRKKDRIAASLPLRVRTAAATVLHMVEEGHDHVGAEILDLEIGRPTLQPIGSELDAGGRSSWHRSSPCAG
jgi:hypothetical protein